VLLPLLAEFATAQKCSGTPDAPEFASVRCFKKRNTCRATCQAGYIFSEKKAKFAAYECQGGEWVMKGGEETRCSPICEPACVYGECVAPNECQCDEGFSGATCEEEEGGEYEEMTTTPEPEAYEEEDTYAEEEDDYGDDYEDEDDHEDHVEYEDHEEAHAVDEEGDDEGAETTMGPEADDDDEVEDDHQDDDVEDESHDDHVDDDGENGDDSTDDDVDGGDDDVDGGDDDVDDDDEGDDSHTAAYGGASEVVPKILVGSAALLMVRAL